MAKLSSSPSGALSGCNADWVTFSCSGVFTDNVRAYRMYDQAQLALVTDKTVSVRITNDQTANGYCFATDFYLLK